MSKLNLEKLNWGDYMSDKDLYSKAEKRVDEKIGFYHHLYAFICVNLFFIILNIFSGGGWWFYWITGLWAIGLLFHFFKVFFLHDNDTREGMIEKEMEKMKK